LIGQGQARSPDERSDIRVDVREVPDIASLIGLRLVVSRCSCRVDVFLNSFPDPCYLSASIGK